jgi:exodeoxyribonuclease VII large subunit
LLEDGAASSPASRTALAHLDPDQVLGRGYSIVRDPDGRVDARATGLATGSPLDITFAEGGAGVTVKDRR